MKKILFVVTLLFVISPLANASPPRDLQLKYDLSGQNLEIKMKHATIENREHYIRMITVTVNSEEPKVYRFTFQKAAALVETVIPLVLKPGDIVDVKAVCSLGGNAQAQLTVPTSETSDKK